MVRVGPAIERARCTPPLSTLIVAGKPRVKLTRVRIVATSWPRKPADLREPRWLKEAGQDHLDHRFTPHNGAYLPKTDGFGLAGLLERTCRIDVRRRRRDKCSRDQEFETLSKETIAAHDSVWLACWVTDG